MLILLLILIPFISAALLIAGGSKMTKGLAMGTALAELALAATALIMFSNGNTAMLTFDQPWIQTLGIRFHIAADGISLLMILLATLLLPVILYASFGREQKNAHVYYALMLMMQGAMIGAFTALDGFLFYIFWELALIPIYFIILVWGGENRQKITFKFFIYTLFGSLFMLLAFIYIYLQAPERSFDIEVLYRTARSLSVGEQGWIMAAFFLAFAVKMPVFPFHTWQPNTYFTAPTSGLMMLSAIMSKMATYGLIRWVIPMVPDGMAEYGYICIGLSVFSVIYASCISVVQKNFKYLIAYSSIAHVSLIAAGLMAANIQSLQGGLIEMLSHAINTIGLFYACDIIMSRAGTADMAGLGGIRAVDSRFAFLFFIVVLSAVALPFTTGFVGEFLLIVGIFKANAIAASIAGLSVILGVVYMFRSFQTIMLGETNALTANFRPIDNREKTVLIIIVIFIIAIGVYPKPILDITEQSVKTLLEGIK